jgi:glyoxylase-like metal-dependent hydrolase (beta-lactamase superfamily II)
MAFRHDRNFWLVSGEGKILWGRTVLPWAPFQVATLGKGAASAVGLAYSRVTSPHPTMALFAGEKGEETALVDSWGSMGWLRYGAGDWRTGWLASLIGDLIVRAGDSVFTVASNDGAWKMLEDGRREKNPSMRHRPFRMAASADGRVVAFGYIVPDGMGVDAEAKKQLRFPPGVVTVRKSQAAEDLWTAAPLADAPPPPALPQPADEFPALAESFRLRPDASVPFRVAVSLGMSEDGSRVAAAEYGGRVWVRSRPAAGKWDPPYHTIPFLPRQRGVLRVFGKNTAEETHSEFPREGLFEVRATRAGDLVWCFPFSWFSRGLAGSAWRPVDEDAQTVYLYDVALKRWTKALQFPDAVSDLALHPEGDRALVSCWDGFLYVVGRDGKRVAKLDAGGPARLAWSKDGRFAAAGTHQGEILSIDSDGRVRWRLTLPSVEPSAPAQPLKRVFDDVNIYQVGRTGPEHAYVGDMWLVKTDEGAFLVDAGGASSIPATLERIKSVGVDPKDVKYLLHSHSHGDHAGAGYLWRTMGLKVVAPETAAFTLGWVMPMLTDYGVWVPRPVDVPLPLKRPGDETEITIAGVKIRAIFAPGHSMDTVIYALELGGKRVVFTGDIGFDNQDILHRCWGDVEKAKSVTEVVRSKAIPFRPDFVFRGHSSLRDGTPWLEGLVQRSEESIRAAEK